MTTKPPERAVPPQVPRRPVQSVTHGETRSDPYAWLRERDNPAVREHLNAENAYLQAVLAEEQALQGELYADMLGRIQESDEQPGVPWGPYTYSTRTVEGQSYPIFCRRPRGDGETAGPEEVLIDPNALAEEGGFAYVRVGFLRPNPDHTVIAYALDTDGGERYTLRFKDLKAGRELPDQVTDVSAFGFAWSASGSHAFYVRNDAAWRPWEVYRHRLGTDPAGDTLVYREEDDTFRASVGRSHSGAYLLIGSSSTLTDEVRVLSADDPEGEFQVFWPRVRGVEYSLQDGGDDWLVLTNAGGAVNFKLLAVPKGGGEALELLPHRPEVMLTGLQVFAQHLVVTGREGGLTRLSVCQRPQQTPRRYWQEVPFDEEVYTAQLGENREFETNVARLVYTSLTTPTTHLDVNLDTLERRVVKRTPVLGGFESANYEGGRLWATAGDGTRVPISLVTKRDAARPGPLLLIGYGSYGFPYDPSFNSNRLALLDRGWTLAIAHVRGGGELGRPWYEDGKLGRKKNTFTDFIACAEHLVREGYTTPDQLVASGGSAGGLLMGAVANLRPDLFRAIIAHVPFVDVINTMLDPSIPLTTVEYDEWGNPNEEWAYAYMRSYSPYDNISPQAYPHIFATTGLNDPRVAYWESAKWVAKLRTHQTGGGKILLRTNFGAGHGGAADRYGALREVAQEYAFALAAVAGRLDG